MPARVPTEILEVRGSLRKNPGRRPGNSPKAAGGVGDPPAHLTEAEAGCWRELEGQSAAGVLTLADRTVLELGARLLAKSRGPAGLDGMRGLELNALANALGRMGLSPVDRSRVSVIDQTTTGDDSPWEKLRQLQARGRA